MGSSSDDRVMFHDMAIRTLGYYVARICHNNKYNNNIFGAFANNQPVRDPAIAVMTILDPLILSFASPFVRSPHKSRRPKRSAIFPRRRPCFSYIIASLSSPHSTPALDNLVKWCHRVGVRLNNIAVLQQGSSRGLYATRDIHPGDQLLAIPRQAALLTNVQSHTVPPLRFLTGLSPQYWNSISWDIQLAIILLDHHLDSQSEFRPYIDALPQNPNSALFAYETLGRTPVAEQLRPYHLHNLADASRARAKSCFNALRGALPHHCRDLVSLRSFCWALCIAASRGFGIPLSGHTESHLEPTQFAPAVPAPVEYALFPGLDMANCSVHCKTRFVYDRDSDVFRVFTGASFSQGEHVYVSYGSKSNDEFMFFYGFVEGSNPGNTVKIVDFRSWVLHLAHTGDVDTRDWDRKLQLLLQEKLTHPDKAFEFRADRIDEDLLFVLRIALAASEELDIMEEELKKEKPKRSRTLSLQNELAVWKAIDKKCESLLEELGDFDENERRRLAQMFSERPCTAAWIWGDPGSDGELLYRYERQTVLSGTIERVRHFSAVSSSVGRICTVLIPPSQSRIRADIFGTMPNDHDTSGVYRYEIGPEDLETYLRHRPLP